jgi:hypothetical protein
MTLSEFPAAPPSAASHPPPSDGVSEDGGALAAALTSALLILAVAFILQFAGTAYRLYLFAPGRARLRAARAEMRPVRVKMRGIEGNTTYFVAYSKLQRQANKIQAEIDACVEELVALGDGAATSLSGGGGGRGGAESGGINGMLDLVSKWTSFLSPKTWRKKALSMVVQPVVALALIYFWWGQPLLVFPPSYFWPFGFILSKPLFGGAVPSGALGALGWFIVCSRGSARLLQSMRLT